MDLAMKGNHKSIWELINQKTSGDFQTDEMKYRDILTLDNMQCRDKNENNE